MNQGQGREMASPIRTAAACKATGDVEEADGLLRHLLCERCGFLWLTLAEQVLLGEIYRCECKAPTL